MADQYDISPEVRKNLEEKARRRNVLRAEFLKQAGNPYRHALGEGGAVFDPAFQRFQAMRATSFDHFKPTPKNVRNGLLILLPFFVFGYFVKTSRDAREAKYRQGEVSYKDRNFKFV